MSLPFHCKKAVWYVAGWCGLLLTPAARAAHPCQSCHPSEVAAYSHNSMYKSLRRPENEPPGTFTSAVSGTRFTIRSGPAGTFQRMERFGGSAEYRVAYVIGSGRHASGYLIQVGDHLFQSPISYYATRKTYDMAPGFEKAPEPDFTRPVGEECVLCHSGRPQYVAGTTNRYKQQPFLEEAISCERCHGPTEAHLRQPVTGSIVNPAKLAPAQRDSVCEQCHLTGITQRSLNPGRDFADFQAGHQLEDTFTVYIRTSSGAFKVISHSEQLALSACARNSQGKLWCGSCHDPHPKTAPTVQTYNAQCQTCHQDKLAKSHPADPNCIRCHMTHRQAQDGGHTVFTDHRITRRRTPNDSSSPSDELKAWREPATELQARNLALAYVNAGIYGHSAAQLERGYRLLIQVQAAMPDDVDVLKALGHALLLGREPAQALLASERVLQLMPASASGEEDVGIALLQSSQLPAAASHLERALELDPLLLSAATALQGVYRRQGDNQKADALGDRMRRLLLNLPKKSAQ